MWLVNGEAIEEMGRLGDGSVDAIIVDLPYGTTCNKWDSILPVEEMWKQFKRITREGGNMVFTSSQPFTSTLVSSNYKQFKYELIWVKTISSGQLNVNIMPLKRHESILVFRNGGSRKNLTYNEELGVGTPYKQVRNIEVTACYGNQKPSETVNSGTRRETSIWEIPNPRIKDGHPTQKPLDLMRKLVRVYSNKGEVVLDCCFGSGVTGVACVHEDRDFIGIELNEEYFSKGKDWILGEQAKRKQNLFNI